jgi:glycosyltransferase involved in cell wall biosynthesis
MSKNITVIGPVPHAEMKTLIESADIYLATTLETFGIGTLEAMAAGVPVLGYDWGGTRDIVQHKVNGYLVRPGDVEGLAEGVKYIRKHRDKLSAAARKRAEQFTWKAAIDKYADVYESIEKETPGVSIVVPSYNYAKYLPECLDSVLAQTEPADEIIVVNDGSTDNTTDVIAPYLPRGINYIVKPNGGVAAARNDGIKKASNPYIVCLDADDKIAPTFVSTLKEALAKDRTLGIAYTGLHMFDDDGHTFGTNFPPPFDWEVQATVSVPPSNCVPSGCMFRRSMWEHAGGFKQIYAPAEDAEFWTRGLSIGYHAKKVTDEKQFIYRAHGGSASRTKTYHAIDMWHPWMRDKRYPFGAPSKRDALVNSYVDPLVSVVIPVGPGHEKYVGAAIDSILGQTFRNWELIVVNDTGVPLDMKVYPFAKVLNGHKKGVSNARNMGIDKANAPLILFLDADDYLDPHTLEKMLDAYVENGGRYIYTDYMAFGKDGPPHEEQCAEYDAQSLLDKLPHGVTVLMDTESARKVKFVSMAGWEDWEFFLHCATIGIHGKRLAEPLLYYRVDTGMRRRESLQKKEELKALIQGIYEPYRTGEKKMGGCCGGSSALPIIQAKRAIVGTSVQQNYIPDEDGNIMTVRMEYIGENVGSISFRGQHKVYRGGNNALHKFIDADGVDADSLVSTGRWKIISTGREQPVSQPVVPQKTEAELRAEVQAKMKKDREMLAPMPEIKADEEMGLFGMTIVEEPATEPVAEPEIVVDKKPVVEKKPRGAKKVK